MSPRAAFAAAHFASPRPTTPRLCMAARRPPRLSVPAAPALSAAAADVATAAALLRAGRLVAFPTETVYGLGADATNASAVEAIFRAKRRPPDNPLIVHVPHLDALIAHSLTPSPLPALAHTLAAAFWPGPLTLVLPLAPDAPLPTTVTASLASVAVRVPAHPVALALLEAAAIPVAAPSANLSGRPSPTAPHHVLADLSDSIAAVIDPGPLHTPDVGLESTVVDLTNLERPTVLRPGAISLRDLHEATGTTFYTPDTSEPFHSLKAPKAPGMKYRHYAPVAPLNIVSPATLEDDVERHLRVGHRIGVLAETEFCHQLDALHRPDVVCVPCGERKSIATYGQALYAALRAFDGEGDLAVRLPVDVILAVPPSDVESGIGEAVMNRLRKAAAGREEDTVPI